MADKLKLLQFTREVYQDMGIYPPHSIQKQHPVNWRNVFILFSLVQIFIVSLAYLIFEAESIVDAGFPFYVINTEFSCAIYYLTNLWKMPKILKLIECFEKFIVESKMWCDVITFGTELKNRCNFQLELGIRNSGTSTKYDELAENIETVLKLFHVVLVKLSFIGISSSNLIVTTVNYFIFDLGDESYYLPTAVMCVHSNAQKYRSTYQS